MKEITQVFNEKDVTELKTGDLVMINDKPAMRRNWRGDGVDYLIPNGNKTVTIINLRGYHLYNGGIIPVWYSEKTINLNKRDLEAKN